MTPRQSCGSIFVRSAPGYNKDLPVKVKVLGCSGAELPGYNPPAFLIDGTILLDAGTIGASLKERFQWEIRDILISHAHLDHIKAIPFLADNIIIKQKHHSVTVFGTSSTLADLRKHLLNDRLWPDFTRISASINPVLRLKNIQDGKPFRVHGYSVTAYAVSHTVPAVGYIIRDEKTGRTLLYTGDTGPTERIWRHAADVHAAIIEVSFPNGMEKLAQMTGHLTPDLLKAELEKMKRIPATVYVPHPKPQYIHRIRREISAIRKRSGMDIKILKDGESYRV